MSTTGKKRDEQLGDTYENVSRMIRLTHQSHGRIKRVADSEYNTHRFITEKASGLLELSPSEAGKLLEYRTFPDEPKSESLVDDAVDRFNDYLVSGANERWIEAVENAVPQAVYATAYLFEVGTAPRK